MRERVLLTFVVFPRPEQRMPRIVPLGAVPLAAANLRRPPYAKQLLKRAIHGELADAEQLLAFLFMRWPLSA